MPVFNNMIEMIGETPMINCSALAEGTGCEIYSKLEYKNPMGSIKDRVALAMIKDAEEKGLIGKGGVIVEPTSGNTGIGLAGIASSRGYRTVIVMPDSMSPERRRIMSAYGAEVVLTPGAEGMSGAIARAKKIVSETPGAFMPSQFTNPANPRVHFETTGPEIYAQMQSKVDIFVAGAGTGGTVSGVGKYLKMQNKDIKIVALEPGESPVISGGKPSPHRIQGIGAGFIPDTLDTGVIDEVISVFSDEAISMAARVAEEMGILVGISSGANLYGAIMLAQREENRGKRIVTVLPDSGERYLSV